MGYCTDYSLSVSKPNAAGISLLESDLLDEEVERMNVFESGCAYDGWYANARWYDFEKDMFLLSSRFPDFIFCLEGSGEDSGDIWMHYYYNGMVMYDGIEIVHHEFDPKKLIKPNVVIEKNYCYEEAI